MKNSPLATLLTTVLAITAVSSVVLCILDIKYTRELRSLQNQVNQININVNLMNGLANETLEYSRTHPAINPVLEAAGLIPKSTPPTPNKNGSK
jgi:hypothetical protein